MRAVELKGNLNVLHALADVCARRLRWISLVDPKSIGIKCALCVCVACCCMVAEMKMHYAYNAELRG